MILRTTALVAIAGVGAVVAMPASAWAIAGGWRVSWSAHPWAVSVGDDECGGVLVAPDRVLTSAGCGGSVYPQFRERVRVGNVRRHVTAVAMQRAWIRQRLDPASRCADEEFACTPDIAILRLDRPIRGVPVPVLATAPPGRRAFVIGHGTVAGDDDETNPAHLRAAMLEVRPDRVCRRWYRSAGDRAALVPQRTVCAADPTPPFNAGTCVGDPGAGLIAYRNGALRLFGVGSWNARCGEGGWPSIFSAVAPYRRFILNRSPTWRPEDLGNPRISGVGAVGATLTCTAPRFSHEPVRLMYIFRTEYDEPERQRGPDSSYVVRARDRGSSLTCEVLAVNAGGIGRAVTSRSIDIPDPDTPAAAAMRDETSSTKLSALILAPGTGFAETSCPWSTPRTARSRLAGGSPCTQRRRAPATSGADSAGDHRIGRMLRHRIAGNPQRDAEGARMEACRRRHSLRA